ncbi:MAG: sensor domain-containing diguanylate cyclase, partial [Acidimicrobiales bacterium]
ATLEVAAQTCLEELSGFAEVNRAFAAVFDDHERVAQQWQWDDSGRPFVLPPVGSSLEELSGSSASFLRIGRTLAVGDLSGLELSPYEQGYVEANGGLPCAAMMVPVMVAGELAGLVGLHSMDEPRVWTRPFVAEVEAFAELLVKMLGRTQQRQALAAANARARRIAEHLPDGLLLLTPDGSIAWSSPSFTTMTGTPAEALEHDRFVDLVSPEDRSALADQLGGLRPVAELVTTAVRIADPAGNWRWADLSLKFVSDPGVPDEIVVTVRDTHDRHLREMQLIRESDRDPLTGLANRGAFERFVVEMATSDAPVAIAFCDVDDFKRFNDELGHDSGDEILRRVAKSINRAVRARDTVARIGGDEFVVVVAEAGPDVALLGERLVEAVRVEDPGLGHDLTLSVGVCGPGPGSRTPEMLKAADEAMYSAKRAGKNAWVYSTLASLGPE